MPIEWEFPAARVHDMNFGATEATTLHAPVIRRASTDGGISVACTTATLASCLESLGETPGWWEVWVRFGQSFVVLEHGKTI